MNKRRLHRKTRAFTASDTLAKGQKKTAADEAAKDGQELVLGQALRNQSASPCPQALTPETSMAPGGKSAQEIMRKAPQAIEHLHHGRVHYTSCK